MDIEQIHNKSETISIYNAEKWEREREREREGEGEGEGEGEKYSKSVKSTKIMYTVGTCLNH